MLYNIVLYIAIQRFVLTVLMLLTYLKYKMEKDSMGEEECE